MSTTGRVVRSCIAGAALAARGVDAAADGRRAVARPARCRVVAQPERRP